MCLLLWLCVSPALLGPNVLLHVVFSEHLKSVFLPCNEVDARKGQIVRMKI